MRADRARGCVRRVVDADDVEKNAAGGQSQNRAVQQLDGGELVNRQSGSVGEQQFDPSAGGLQAISRYERHAGDGGLALSLALQRRGAFGDRHVWWCSRVLSGVLSRTGGGGQEQQSQCRQRSTDRMSGERKGTHINGLARRGAGLAGSSDYSALRTSAHARAQRFLQLSIVSRLTGTELLASRPSPQAKSED